MKIVASRSILAKSGMLLLLALIFSGLALGYRFTRRQPVPVSAGKHSFATVVIDAGHGGFDGGASAADGTLEKTLNLQIALRLQAFLDAFGLQTVMTRTTDTGTNDPSAATIREKKRSDLKNRLALLQEEDHRILVSIHQNHYSQSKYNGTQVFYSGNHPGSAALAECIRAGVAASLQPQNRREIKQSGSEIYLLHQAQAPAVMVECGFLSNAAETEKLKTETYQTQLAFVIALGILEYLQAEETDNGF